MEYGLQAWMLMSASLVLLMTTPALALFYGGMSRSKSVLNMLMMSFSALGIVGIVYVLWGWSMSYGTHGVAMLFANPFELFGLRGVEGGDLLGVGFQLTFAVIAAALVSGAVADRLKFSAWLLFLPIWVTLSYFPLAHMVWGGGFLSHAEGGLADLLVGGVAPVDYAGGTVVHINAGVAGLVLALMLGRRIGFGREAMQPHNLTLTMIGAGLLWFGWFGFNVGSWVPGDLVGDEAGASWIAESSLVWLNTTVAACGAMLGWLLVEKVRDSHATTLGAASGIVAGLVAITPAAGAVSPLGAIVLGAVAGVLCAFAVGMKHHLGVDDALDVVGVHLVGGLVGTIGIGFLAINGGLVHGGGSALLIVQVAVAIFAMVWAAIATVVAGLIVRILIGLRVDHSVEVAGLDRAEHGESAYALGMPAGSPYALRGAVLRLPRRQDEEVSA
jgi:Amt family ammonium transporter